MSEAATQDRPQQDEPKQPMATPYERIGGEAGVRQLVDAFYRIMATAPEAAGIRAMHAEDLGPKTNAASGDLIFVGRLSPEKGAALFAEAANRAGLSPTFIGDGPIADELKARYPKARFLGWLPPDEVRRHMRAARALIFPSLWYEGQPLTVLEAKAMGTPVVVSDICAGREEIEDGVVAEGDLREMMDREDEEADGKTERAENVA